MAVQNFLNIDIIPSLRGAQRRGNLNIYGHIERLPQHYALRNNINLRILKCPANKR